MLTITNMATVRNFEIVCGIFNSDSMSVEIMQRSRSVNCILVTLQLLLGSFKIVLK